MKYILKGIHPRFGFFSGLHGDESQIIQSVAENITKFDNKIDSYLFIPECSPSAVRLKSRFNQEGIDLNRSFTKNPNNPETLNIIQLVTPHHFKTCIDFHEDNQIDGVYIYDSDNIENSEALHSFRNRVSSIASLYSGIDDRDDCLLGCTAANGYYSCIPPQKDNLGDYIYEGFLDNWALIEGKAERWLTLEVPTNLHPIQKNQIVEIFFNTILEIR